MTIRFVTAVSVLALVSACSSQPGPSAVNATEQGYNAYLAGNFAAAEKAYDTALVADPADVSAMLGLAEVYEKTNRASEAVELYSRVRAERSGTIRVWNDGGVRQQGVTELANRRLVALGHQTQVQTAAVVAAPAVTLAPVATEIAFQAPPATFVPEVVTTQVVTTEVYTPEVITTAAIAPQPTQYWPDSSSYVLDENGIVNYVDVAAAQPILAPVAEAPTATGQTYYVDQEGTQVIAGRVFETQEAASLAAPAPVYRTVSTNAVSAVPAVATSYEPVPTVYEPAPLLTSYQSAPAAIAYEAAPTVPTPTLRQALITPAAPIAAPVPSIARQAAAPQLPVQSITRSQPGYAVIDGDLVYVSAEDIANGAVGRAIPEATGVDPLNGTQIPNLN